jgi:hypothetical protein
MGGGIAKINPMPRFETWFRRQVTAKRAENNQSLVRIARKRMPKTGSRSFGIVTRLFWD